MVANLRTTKSDEKNHLGKNQDHSKYLDAPASPTSSHSSDDDEVALLRARNKVLTEALMAVKESASQQAKKHFELVWFARNRTRFPNHKMTKQLSQSEEHREELEKLKTKDADYFHGFHSGILAAARLFEDHASIIDARDGWENDLDSLAAKHSERVNESEKAFPHRHVTEGITNI